MHWRDKRGGQSGAGGPLGQDAEYVKIENSQPGPGHSKLHPNSQKNKNEMVSSRLEGQVLDWKTKYERLLEASKVKVKNLVLVQGVPKKMHDLVFWQ